MPSKPVRCLNFTIIFQTDVAMVAGVLHLDDNHFARSKEFIPERWLQNDHMMEGCPNHGKSENPFTFLPFGFGARTCIGKRFAEMEVNVVLFRWVRSLKSFKSLKNFVHLQTMKKIFSLSRILREFKVEWHYGPLKYVQALIVTPSNDLKYKMIPLK